MLPNLIYGLVDPRTGCVRYVGKSTSGLARPERHRKPYYRKALTPKNAWLDDLATSGRDYEIVVLEEVPRARCRRAVTGGSDVTLLR